jgi:hypothetical protein
MFQSLAQWFAANPVDGVMYALIAVSFVVQSLCGGGDGDFDFDGDGDGGGD